MLLNVTSLLPQTGHHMMHLLEPNHGRLAAGREAVPPRRYRHLGVEQLLIVPTNLLVNRHRIAKTWRYSCRFWDRTPQLDCPRPTPSHREPKQQERSIWLLSPQLRQHSKKPCSC